MTPLGLSHCGPPVPFLAGSAQPMPILLRLPAWAGIIAHHWLCVGAEVGVKFGKGAELERSVGLGDHLHDLLAILASEYLSVGLTDHTVPSLDARTIARMPALTAPGRIGQALITCSRSGNIWPVSSGRAQGGAQATSEDSCKPCVSLEL